jgi:hypothetical protein
MGRRLPHSSPASARNTNQLMIEPDRPLSLFDWRKRSDF